MAKKSSPATEKKSPAKKKPAEKKAAEKKTAEKKGSVGKSTSTAGKKPAAKTAKATAAGAARKGTAAGKNRLVQDVTALLKKMDEDSLTFMKRQAEVIVSAGEYNEIRKKTLEALSHLETGTAVQYAPDDVTIERRDDSFFNIVVRGTSVFFNIDELRALTRLCHAASNPVDGSRRLITWFRRERGDFLKDCGIESASDPSLKRLHDIIVSTYKVRS